MATIPTKFDTGVFYVLDSSNRLITSIEVNTYEDYRKIMSIRTLQGDDTLKFKFDTNGNISSTLVENGLSSDISFSGLPADLNAFGALDDAPAFGPKSLSEDFPSEDKSVVNTVNTVSLTRQSFISMLKFGYTNSGGTLHTITGDFEDGDILFVVPNDYLNNVTISQTGNISLVGASTFTLRSNQDTSDAGRFIALRYMGGDDTWVEVFRNRVLSDELPQQTPTTGKFYLSKDSAGTLAFSSIENTSTQNLVAKFNGQISTTASVILGNLPANIIILYDQILAKLDTAATNDSALISLSVGGNELITNTAWASSFIYGGTGAIGTVTVNNSAGWNSPVYKSSASTVTFSIEDGSFTQGKNSFSIIVPYIEL